MPNPVTPTIPVYEWLLDGRVFGCGTRVEFDYWNEQDVNPVGLTLGNVICHEPASEDGRRLNAWKRAA